MYLDIIAMFYKYSEVSDVNDDKSESLIYQFSRLPGVHGNSLLAFDLVVEESVGCFLRVLRSIGTKMHERFLDTGLDTHLRTGIRDYFGGDTRRGGNAARYCDNNYARGTPCG